MKNILLVTFLMSALFAEAQKKITTKSPPPRVHVDSVTVSDAKQFVSSVEKLKLALTMPLQVGINAQTGATYTFVAADSTSKLITASNVSAQTYTIPPNASVAFPVGTQISVTQIGAGQVTFAAGAGVTLYSADGALKLRTQYSTGTAIKIAAPNSWLLIGDITN